MVTKEYVYLVQRYDHDHHTDRKGRMAAVSLHKTPSSANEAAKLHMEREAQKGETSAGIEPSVEYESLDKAGLFRGCVQTFENRRDNFKIQVKKMQLHDDPAASTTARSAHNNENTATNAASSFKRQHETICLD